VWDEALELGVRNQEMVALAKNHCTRMEFVQNSGTGMAEDATGLPINPREVRCPIAHGRAVSSNLAAIVLVFYREHCVGCEQQRPTGLLPTLGAYIIALDAAADAERVRKADELAALHDAWKARVEQRLGMKSRCDDAMANALTDMGSLDVDPANASGQDGRAALARLTALAERAPELFAPVVIAHGVELVERHNVVPALLDPLRIVGLSRPEFAPLIVAAALTIMRTAASGPAGRCLADLIGHAVAADLDDAVCRSAIVLAGAPMRDPMSPRRGPSDPVSLLALAEQVPDRLVAVLLRMLPGPATEPLLHLPPAVAANSRPKVPTYLIGKAAGAIRILAATHPGLAARLVEPLLFQLTSDEVSTYDNYGLREIERALAVMLVLGVGDVPGSMIRIGSRRSKVVGERLIRVLAVASDLVRANPRWREPGDPVPDEGRATFVSDMLFEMAIGRLAGDWGSGAIDDAAELVERLAKERPAAMLVKVPGILGGVLGLIDAQKEPRVSPLTLVDDEPPELKMLTAISDEFLIGRAIQRLLDAVEAVASADAAAVCAALLDVLTNERDSARSADVAYYLLKALGDIGRSQGAESDVLQLVLPALYTYLVGSDVLLRARAIDAWVTIAGRHQLPSTLEDLLPALVSDPYLEVIKSVLKASVSVEWSSDAEVTLFNHAAIMVAQIDGRKHPEIVKDAITTILVLSSSLGVEGLRDRSELAALNAAASLGKYELRDVFQQRKWGSVARRSARMASLRLRQAADPEIAQFSDRGDDSDVVALLDCGVGLAALSVSDLTGAALAFGPNNPVVAAEFVEVAWRANRLDDAVTISSALVDAIPKDLGYQTQRRFFEMLKSAVNADAVATAGGDWSSRATNLVATVDAFADDGNSGSIAYITDTVRATFALRQLLMDTGYMDGSQPVESLVTRAGQLTAAGEELSRVGQKATATGAYLRSVGGLCEVVAHLMRAEAAALDADAERVAAHGYAASRRCDLIAHDVEQRLGPDDPIGGPLMGVIADAGAITPGESVVALVSRWAQLPLPVNIIEGSTEGQFARRASVFEQPTDPAEGEFPVAVVLASLDGRLITGPEVIRDPRVCELGVRVQPGEWPEWADRLDGELLSHLTPTEITTPTFSWSRDDHVGDGETYEQSGSVRLRFSLAAGMPAPPLRFRLSWAGNVDGQPFKQAIDVAGHRELRLRPYDETRDRATDYPVFDERLLSEYDRLSSAGFDDSQLRAFCRLFTAICRAGLSMTWEKKYRRGTWVSERSFHDDLYARLMDDPELGGRLERGSPLALGYLDIRHDGITAELKVERTTPVTKESAPKYIGQPTQYAAADGARLSILAILDMSRKQLPIGTPENYVFPLDPKLHGLDYPQAPSTVMVLIVNGNLPTPSSWSRKKIPVQQPGKAP
jgi:hypothetical protein